MENIANEVIASLRMDDANMEDRKQLIGAIFKVDDALFTKLLGFANELKDYVIVTETNKDFEQEAITTINFDDQENEDVVNEANETLGINLKNGGGDKDDDHVGEVVEAEDEKSEENEDDKEEERMQ